MESDGNLVVYDQRGRTAIPGAMGSVLGTGKQNALWNSNTAGSGATECVMQGDGNLVLKDKNGRVAWATNTDGNTNATLSIKDDGNLVMSKESGTAFWSNGKIITAIKPGAPLGGVLTKVRNQDDAGSGRDAGNVLGEAVPISPATEQLDGELSQDDSMDVYSIELNKGSKLFLKLINDSGQDYIFVLLNSNGDIIETPTRE